MPHSIFYSWQNDSPSKGNRYLIRDCLCQVLKRLNKEDGVDEAIRLESDTAGIPGTPDIANTIFAKIREAGVFVADVTLSSKAESGKRSPNPNALIELGYAFSAIGDTRVISVMNTTFGNAKDLPFDLSHKRWPIQYSLSASDLENSTKRDDVRKNLTGSLYNAIRLVLDDVHSHPVDQLKLAGAPSFNYVQQCISLSDPREDWERISSGYKSIAVNKRDVNLRLEVNYSEEGTQCRDFKEEWANRHPDPQATGYWCDIYYNFTHVSRTILVSVDGGRAQLPIPRQKGIDGKYTEVLPFDYRLAQIFDTLGTLDEYMTRSRLSLAF
jgi:hypothetical protein